jgi:hypothetical protein
MRVFPQKPFAKPSICDRIAFADRDRFRCGSKANPNIHGTTHYLEIIDGSRIVSSETIVMDGKRLCASLTTLEVISHGGKTKLKSTTQIASFLGEDMVKGYQLGGI